MDIRVASAYLQMTKMLTATDSEKQNTSIFPTAQASSNIESSQVSFSATSRDEYGANQLLEALRNRQQLYSVQFKELTEFRAEIAEIGVKAEKVKAASAGTEDEVLSALKDLRASYNQMTTAERPNFQKGGSYDGLDVAEYARFAMERDVEDGRNGADNLGYGGWRNVGVSINPENGLMEIDEAKVRASLTNNSAGVRGALSDFGGNLAKTASVYTDDNKFIGNRLKNLAKALDWLKENLPLVEAQASSAKTSNLGLSQEEMARLSPTARKAVMAYAAGS